MVIKIRVNKGEKGNIIDVGSKQGDKADTGHVLTHAHTNKRAQHGFSQNDKLLVHIGVRAK